MSPKKILWKSSYVELDYTAVRFSIKRTQSVSFIITLKLTAK